MHINIIECDTLYPELLSEYRSYGRMFEQYFQRFNPELSVSFYNALENHLPVAEKDAVYLITGSKAGVYENHAWIAPLITWVQNAFKQQSRLLGICFGHQLLAEALGGKVINSEKGWGTGVRTLAVEENGAERSQLSLIYSHQDQVIKLPAQARVLLGDDFCPVAAFAIEQQVLGFQGHPEFTAEYTRKLYAYRKNCIGKNFEQALKSLEQSTDASYLGERLMRWMQTANFQL